MSKQALITRSFKIDAPDWLLPIYDVCQENLDAILADSEQVAKLYDVELRDATGKFKLAGDIEKDVKKVIKDDLTGRVPNAGWYRNILVHNVISLLKSIEEKREIFNILKRNNYKIDDQLRDELCAENLYPTNGLLKNLAKSKALPELPQRKTFVLDYSKSCKQMFFMDDDLTCHVQVLSHKQAEALKQDEWRDFSVTIPDYIRTLKATHFSKPSFKMKNGEFEGQMSYSFKPRENNGENILGVDLGRKKLYSGTVLRKDGACSDEFVPSHELTRLRNKETRLNTNIDSTYKKMQRVEAYGVPSIKQELRKKNYDSMRSKRKRLHEKMAWLIACEVVDFACKHDCKEIHLENLSWVESRAGKWNFSDVQTKIQLVAELHSIRVVKVNAANSSKNHPITGEKGRESGRDIVFDDGMRLDRDQLAGLNMAVRNKRKEDVDNFVRELRRRRAVRSRRVSNRQKRFCLKGSNIVLSFSSRGNSYYFQLGSTFDASKCKLANQVYIC